MRKSTDGNIKNEITAYGIRALLSRHKEIRKLKRLHAPHFHGFRMWPSSWLMMDFLKRCGFPERSKVLDLGCGWGLAGIYCAINHSAAVTAVDIDSEVFPYLKLHARINNVDIKLMQKGFDDIRMEQLKHFQVIIGADICFWDTMVDSLKKLIKRALSTGIHLVIITDPGRSPFENLGHHFVKYGKGDMIDWAADHPYAIEGRILKISGSDNPIIPSFQLRRSPQVQ